MKKETISLLSPLDNYKIEADFYQIDKPLALVVIIGGMMEHKKRYESLANYLVKNNYSVLVCENRGHGESAFKLGYFGKEEGWLSNLKDLKLLVDKVAEEYSSLPKYLITHSMGTLFGRGYLKRYPNDFQKYIFSGTPADNPLVKAALTLGKLDKIIHGEFYQNKLLHKLVVLDFNKNIEDAKTDYDWLSYNEANVKAYIEDPLCGVVFTTSGFIDLFKITIDAYSKKDWNVSSINPAILFLSGDDDPCSTPEQFAYAITHLKNRGYKEVSGKRYPNKRHEIFHEDSHELIFEDILNFFKK